MIFLVDALLRAGRFEEAARGYEEILRKDPNNAHAVRQRGYIALLSNRFADAESTWYGAVQGRPYQVSVNPPGRVPPR